jgi:hypothetical protein
MTEPQTSPDLGRETRIVDVKGRSVVVRQLNDSQLMLMAREAKVLQGSAADGARKMSATARIFDILESAVVQQEDRDYLIDLVTAGDLGLADLIGFVTVFVPEQDDKPKVRRGRPARAR